MKKLLITAGLCAANIVFAQTWDVTITNITKSQIFSPPIVVAHDGQSALFQLGQPASTGLSTMAEDGDLSVLMTELNGNEKVGDVNAAGGMVMPGQSVTVQINTSGNFNRISVAGMLVSTNDAFFAVNSAVAPTMFLKSAGISQPISIMALAYDAGSETNTEDCASIPGPPCGNPGVRDTSNAEGFVHIHSGIHGVGDVTESTYTWDGPVALVEIKRAF
ncbi:MAG: spondin domain-containing protein [Acidobacteria bacterium]|nr:spondin domain-containing protein [Acidobacteriota bacterium]